MNFLLKIVRYHYNISISSTDTNDFFEFIAINLKIEQINIFLKDIYDNKFK